MHMAAKQGNSEAIWHLLGQQPEDVHATDLTGPDSQGHLSDVRRLTHFTKKFPWRLVLEQMGPCSVFTFVYLAPIRSLAS